MGDTVIQGVIQTPLKIIDVAGGPVMHAMKNVDPGFAGFGEAYFSVCERGAIKAWKRRRKMTLNLIAPVGSVLLALYDDADRIGSKGCWQRVVLSPDNYVRLTVPPNIWIGLQGISSGLNLLLNVADIPHDPDEVERLAVAELPFEWM